MRIIGGSLKGRSISPPEGYKVRPTTDFAREGLFNILDNEYEFADLQVLDLFGGTGAISFEFASRGAAGVHCVEMNADNARFIRAQAAALGLGGVVTVVHHNVFDFLPLCRKSFDLVFADPPYALEGLADIPDKIFATRWTVGSAAAGEAAGGEVTEAGLLYPGGYFILEHPADYSFRDHPRFVKERKYGNVHFSFFE